MIDLRNGSRLQFVDQPSEQIHSIRATAPCTKMFVSASFFVCNLCYPSVFTLDHFCLFLLFTYLAFSLLIIAIQTVSIKNYFELFCDNYP